jgi:hypothetical protein
LTLPSTPSASIFLTVTNSGFQRSTKPTMVVTPALSTASFIRFMSFQWMVIGFSMTMCLPA